MARLVLVGEQPGDQEDREGVPFVGPAGRLLDRALGEAGIAAEDCYVTNAVKHFRFTPGPRRRLHRTPDLVHIMACRPWLEAELKVLDPEVIVCLGATAARVLLRGDVRIMRDRGLLMAPPAWARTTAPVLVTVHPSAVLRADDEAAAFTALVADLGVAAAALPPRRDRASER